MASGIEELLRRGCASGRPTFWAEAIGPEQARELFVTLCDSLLIICSIVI
jgi:hypothetical protein